MGSVWFDHECKIDAFAFRYVKAAGREKSPVWRSVLKHLTGNRHRQDDKPWPGAIHEFGSATLSQRREKAVHPRAKIPDETRLFEFDRGKLHVRRQRSAAYLKQLICREKPCNNRRDH